MTAHPPYAPARIWVVHGLGFLAGLGAMAGVVWLLLADFLSDQVKAGPLMAALMLAVVAGASVWAGALRLWLGRRRWLTLAGIAALALLLTGGGLMGAHVLAGGVALGGMGGER